MAQSTLDQLTSSSKTIPQPGGPAGRWSATSFAGDSGSAPRPRLIGKTLSVSQVLCHTTPYSSPKATTDPRVVTGSTSWAMLNLRAGRYGTIRALAEDTAAG